MHFLIFVMGALFGCVVTIATMVLLQVADDRENNE